METLAGFTRARLHARQRDGRLRQRGEGAGRYVLMAIRPLTGGSVWKWPISLLGVTMERFETARLRAERLRENHLADLITLHLDPHVMRHLGGVRSPETTRAYVTANLEHWDRFGFGLWVLRTRDGEFAGRAGIRHMVVEAVPKSESPIRFSATCGERDWQPRSLRLWSILVSRNGTCPRS
jgi:Acetyltransferase (GNAT) domain